MARFNEAQSAHSACADYYDGFEHQPVCGHCTLSNNILYLNTGACARRASGWAQQWQVSAAAAPPETRRRSYECENQM